jgi:hypothetical protein
MRYSKLLIRAWQVSIALVTLVGCADKAGFYASTFHSDVFTQNYEESGYDFLWMLDNSPTMDNKRAYLQNNIQTFVNILTTRKAISYQMAAVTIDYFSNNGNLAASPGGQTVVSNTTSATPVQDFASIIGNITDTATSFWDQGLESVYQAAVQHGSTFIRDGVPLVIIFVTDGDDFSCQGNCTGYEPPHNFLWVPFPIDRYVSYFTQLKAGQNSEVIVYPIIGYTGVSQCDFESNGTRYLSFMNGANQSNDGAVVGSVCINDIATSYNNIAQTIANRGTVFKLSKPSNGQGISVYINGVLLPNNPNNYIYDSVQNAIVFTGSVPTKGSSIQVIYNQGATSGSATTGG